MENLVKSKSILVKNFEKNMAKSWEQFSEILRKIWWNHAIMVQFFVMLPFEGKGSPFRAFCLPTCKGKVARCLPSYI